MRQKNKKWYNSLTKLYHYQRDMSIYLAYFKLETA